MTIILAIIIFILLIGALILIINFPAVLVTVIAIWWIIVWFGLAYGWAESILERWSDRKKK